MKKIYEKPLIAIENYVLSQTIASCETKIGFSNSDCVSADDDAPDGFRNLAGSGFFTGECTYEPDVEDPNDSICYHTSASLMFTS